MSEEYFKSVHLLYIHLIHLGFFFSPPLIPVSAPGAVPPGWAPWDLAHPFELVELEESCKEFREVKGAMFDTLKEDYFTISNIYRIQSLGLWKEYKM